MYNFNKIVKDNSMKKYLNKNYLILIPILILNIISLFYLHTTSYFYKQLIFLILSYIILFISSKINISYIYKYLKYLYYFSLLLLILVLFIGKETHGAKAWINLGIISIQPSEIMKLVLTIYIPYLYLTTKSSLKIIISYLIPTILTFLEPDTGAILLYSIIPLTILLHTKISQKKLLITLLITSIFLIFNIYLYFFNKDLLINIYGTKLFYRLDRIISFKEQNNIQTINSLISIGSHKLLYIPENHNDFIFASIISLYSPIITIIIIISYIIIFKYYINKLSQKNNIRNLYNHITLHILFFQIIYSILMNLSLVPIIGLPLPFLSYGGSYLVTLYTEIGLSINLNNHPNSMVYKDNKYYKDN